MVRMVAALVDINAGDIGEHDQHICAGLAGLRLAGGSRFRSGCRRSEPDGLMNYGADDFG